MAQNSGKYKCTQHTLLSQDLALFNMIAITYIAPQMSQMCNLLGSIQQPHKLGFIIIPTLQMRKLKHRRKVSDFTKVSADK